VDRKEGSYPVKAFVLEPGRRRPLGVGASNIAILANMPQDEIARICLANSNRIAQKYPRYTEAELTNRIKKCQELGYSFTDVLEAAGVKSIGMCIHDQDGHPIAAISISTIAARLGTERVQEVVTFLRSAVEEIEHELKRQPIEIAIS
jgi:DNA-binding IclR family transcriptional regulator